MSSIKFFGFAVGMDTAIFLHGCLVGAPLGIAWAQLWYEIRRRIQQREARKYQHLIEARSEADRNGDALRQE